MDFGSPRGLLSLRGLLFLGVFLIVIVGPLWFILPMVEDAQPEDLERETLEHQIHERVNDQRVDHGLDRLEFDDALRPVTRNYSERMATEDFFAHISPDGDSFRDRYDAHGYECQLEINETHEARGGENLAQTQYVDPVETSNGTERYTTSEELADAVVEGWMNSPDHRENILTEYWEHEAIGVYITDDRAVYVTQNFC